jgi:hypothetical protein
VEALGCKEGGCHGVEVVIADCWELKRHVTSAQTTTLPAATSPVRPAQYDMLRRRLKP